MIGSTECDLSGHLALVVEDDPRIRLYIKTILQSANVQVLEACDGLAALEVFHVWRGRIDLVITDIRMPRMTGKDLAISLKSDSPAIPLIFVSGEPATVDMNDPIKGWFFVEKPFSPQVLLDATGRCFRLPSQPRRDQPAITLCATHSR